jgi:hypothetical protein
MLCLRRRSKSKNIKKHFSRRCLERTGIYLDAKDIVRRIQKNELEFASRTSNSRTVFKYNCPITKKEYRIVYDKNKHDVVTIYPYTKNKNRFRKIFKI